MTTIFIAPTEKTLIKLYWLTDKQRKELRQTMKHPINFSNFEHSSHTLNDRMHELNTIAETHGPEYLVTNKRIYQYLNTGDTYCSTIIVHFETKRFFICDWGTIAEQEGVD